MDLALIKSDVVKASHILHQQGIAAAFGHVSARIPGTDTFVFPPRMSPALVREDNLLVLDVEGDQLSGDGRPNTEFWIHARIYKARPDVQAVCHVHPPSCVVLSSLGETIRPLHASGAVFRNDVQVFNQISLIRTRELGDAVASTLGNHGAMLLRGHGVNVAEKDVRRVCVMTLWMEEAANYQLRAMSAGTPRYFTAEELETIYPQVSGDEVSKRVWEYLSSRIP
ncbi:MAG TPA: class II aldolase/adducin family protein [Gammaproteobacteria bacterium]|nr:class II aldolase/adducin family protein [Gammaproteobacteria bacterium]